MTVRNLFNIFFCGGDCAEDIQTHLREALENIPGNSVPSADTLLRGKKVRTNSWTCSDMDANTVYLNKITYMHVYKIVIYYQTCEITAS
jgi:hypothetical protein